LELCLPLFFAQNPEQICPVNETEKKGAHTMKLVRAFAVGAIAAAFAVGCSDGTGADDEITIGDLVGTWTATEFNYTNQADLNETADMMLFGLELTITVAGGGNFTGTFRQTAVSPVVSVVGTMAIDGDTMTLTFVQPASFDEPITGAFTLTTSDPDVLRLTATTGVEFDFGMIGGTPGEVPATLRLEMER